jgi:uncharacterized protein
VTPTLNLIIKSTRKCNLRCSYCHDWRARGQPVSFEVLAHVVSKALRNPDRKVINFIWHGGEPLLLGQEFFRRALTLQERFLLPGQYVINSVQTNGTLLTDEWCAFFGRNHFTVGLSIDGPEPIHNLNRNYASGRGSYDDVLRGIELLKRRGLSFGILLVLNQNTQTLPARQIFDFVLHELGVKAFSFLPAVPDNIPGELSGERITTDFFDMAHYSDFMIKIFDYWFALDDPDVSIRELDGLMRSIMGGNPMVCTLAGGCIGQNYHIEPTGDIFHCDKYLGDPAYRLGNILIDDFDGLPRTDKFRALIADESRSQAQLVACPHYRICNGGCPHDRYIARKYDTGFDGRCCGQSALIEHIRSRLAGQPGRTAPALPGRGVATALANSAELPG